jgi:hypothetical protein
MYSGGPKAAVWSGVLATFVASAAGYWFPAVGLPPLDLPALNGALVVSEEASISFAWTVGALEMFGGGIVMALMYAFWVQMHLPGPGWLRGMIWGGVLSVVVGLTVFPLLYGGGMFGIAWDGRTAVSVIAWHLLWGGVLGVAYHKSWEHAAGR